MFGIGLPELLVIMGVALIVVGPEKLPELAKSLARGVLELKKTAAALKDSLDEEVGSVKEPWDQLEREVYPDKNTSSATAEEFKEPKVIESPGTDSPAPETGQEEAPKEAEQRQ